MLAINDVCSKMQARAHSMEFEVENDEQRCGHAERRERGSVDKKERSKTNTFFWLSRSWKAPERGRLLACVTLLFTHREPRPGPNSRDASRGAMVWNVFIAAYNLAGSILLFQKGQFLFFNYPEYQIYGGIGMAVMAICIITTIGMANNSYMFMRLCFFLWPVILLVVAVRAAFMMFQLDRQQTKIVWECNNGGQLWGTAGEEGTNNGTMPSGLCSAGFHSLYIAFVFSLAIDLALQLYAYFMCWRFKRRIEHYYALATKENNIYSF